MAGVYDEEMRYLILLLFLIGCSYVSTNIVKIKGDDVKFNPITRTISGQGLEFDVKRTMNMELF